MGKFKEITLELPWETVDQCNGFGLDFGGSLCKVIYLHKDDWKEPGQRTASTVHLLCVNIFRTDFEEGLKYLKDRVYIRRKSPDEKPLVFATGIGGSQFASQIQDTFKVRTCNIMELDCFIAAFVYLLKNKKRGDLVHELNQPLIQKTLVSSRQLTDVWEAMKKDSNFLKAKTSEVNVKTVTFPQELPLEGEKMFTDYIDLFPCFVVMLGSNGVIFMVNEDSTFEIVTDMMRTGRAFLGLGSVLSNSKSHDELMDKVGKGDMHSVNEFLSDLTGDDGMEEKDENFYTNVTDLEDSDNPAYMFGKCVFKDIKSFKEEDFAKSLHHYMCTDIVQQTYLPLRFYSKVRHVFFSGGFPGHPLTRDALTAEWVRREARAFSFIDPGDLRYTHFVKHGSHMGAIGAYLNQMLQFKPAPEETPAI